MSGGMYFYRAGQSRPYRRGRGPSAPQFWGFRSIYAHTLWRRPTKCDVVTHMGRDLFLGVSHDPDHTGGVPALPYFWVPFRVEKEPQILGSFSVRLLRWMELEICFHGVHLSRRDEHHGNMFPIPSMKNRTETNSKPTFTELEPKTNLIFKVRRRPGPFPGAQDHQNLISWRRSLHAHTDPVWWRSMQAISSYRGNRHRPPACHKHTRTGPIKIHCAAS